MSPTKDKENDNDNPKPSRRRHFSPLARKDGVKVAVGVRVNHGVSSAVAFLDELESKFKAERGQAFNLYSEDGPVARNLKGSQHSGVEDAISGRIFGRVDYFMKKEGGNVTGMMDSGKDKKDNGDPYSFVSADLVARLEGMIKSNNTKTGAVNSLLNEIVASIEVNPDWKKYWASRPFEAQMEIENSEGKKDTLKNYILQTLVYKIVGECHAEINKKLVVDGNLEKTAANQRKIVPFMNLVKESSKAVRTDNTIERLPVRELSHFSRQEAIKESRQHEDKKSPPKIR